MGSRVLILTSNPLYFSCDENFGSFINDIKIILTTFSTPIVTLQLKPVYATN